MLSFIKPIDVKSSLSKISRFSPILFLMVGIVSICFLMVPLRNASTVSLIDDSEPQNNAAYVANNIGMRDTETIRETKRLGTEESAVYSTASATNRPAFINPVSTNGSTLISDRLVSDNQHPVLVEMFLSQSCSSCVPAARYVRDLAKRDDVVVISWHVDYWDRLNTHNGRWKDPYSDKAYTQRQRNYGINKSANGRIYTPQAVIDGRMEAVGSRRAEIETYITQANDLQTSRKGELSVHREGNKLLINVGENSSPSQAWLISFTRETQTSILGGENAGLDWSEANVVFDVQSLGAIGGKVQDLKAKMPSTIDGKKTGCAIVVQSKSLGPVTRAAYCPS